MAGFASLLAEFTALDAQIVAAAAQPFEAAEELAKELSFPVAYGVTRQDSQIVGAWWEERRSIIQPSEFVLGADRRILAASYSDGPLGRMDAADVLRFLRLTEQRSKS